MNHTLNISESSIFKFLFFKGWHPSTQFWNAFLEFLENSMLPENKKNMFRVHFRFFEIFDFSNSLRIKSEISHLSKRRLWKKNECNLWDVVVYFSQRRLENIYESKMIYVIQSLDGRPSDSRPADYGPSDLRTTEILWI